MNNLNETGHEQLLESLKLSLPLVQRLFPIDVMFALADMEKFIYYLPGTELDIRIQEGMPSRREEEYEQRWRQARW
ncbi:hypothetical protein [Paenibacillus sp. DMB5]|uniref:hypothetical protein n=1 Tax=Paenibacillus sp. DMB5 TaxID=1780103 RepID=UPI001F5245D3|nr:hypothetical protein [Paenibacillus sp. DMB5]